MTQRHLGEGIHELLDGRLRGADAFAAMAHLDDCDECATRWRELRAAREALNSSQAGIDMRFAQQLLDRERIAQIAAREDARNVRAVKPRNRVPALATASFAIIALIVVAAAWRAGEPDALALEFAESARTSAQSVAYVDPQGMRSGELLRSWVHPDFSSSHLVPIEATVVEKPSGRRALVATLLSGMDIVTVVQQHGRLTPALTEDLPLADVPDREVFVVHDEEPASVVWQTGDVVIGLACECALETLESAAADFPSGAEPGFVERLGDGFMDLADALDG